MSGPERALILMAKAPIPGTVKTRLCPPLTRRAAAEFYSCLLLDAAEEMASRLRGVRRFLFFSPPEGESLFRSGAFSSYERIAQRGEDLGERMEHALRTALARGARQAVLIGADCPSLSAGRVRSAFREISGGADLVLGPSADGGFYLIGLSRPVPSLFRGVAWGTGSVLSVVTKRGRLAGLSYALLPEESDVDTREDLAALRNWAAIRDVPPCPRTRRWLTSWAPGSSRAGPGSAAAPCRGR